MRPPMVLRVAGFVLLCSLLVASPAPPVTSRQSTPEPRPDPWFAAHVLIARLGWLAVRADQRVAVGDRVVVFDAGCPALPRTITSLVSADSARSTLASSSPAPRPFGWSLAGERDLAPRALACYAPSTDVSAFVEEDAPFALCDLPAGALVLGSEGDTLSAAQLAALAPALSRAVPRAWLGRDVLRFGRRFRGSGHALCEIDLGRPAWSRAPGEATIDSIHVRRVFLLDGHVLGAASFSRVSGVEERASTEPPQLTAANWFDTTDRTAGFLSRDRGRTWDRLAVDLGAEGVDWSATRLAPGLPELWRFYLYTPD